MSPLSAWNHQFYWLPFLRMKVCWLPNTLLAECVGRRIFLRPMKLQKLMYFACGAYLAKFYEGKSDKEVKAGLAKGEGWLMPPENDFYAFPYGPVERETYGFFAKFRSGNITEMMHENVGFDLKKKRDLKGVLLDVIRDYSKATDVELSDITHKKGYAWDRVWVGERPYRGIEKFEIYSDFRKR